MKTFSYMFLHSSLRMISFCLSVVFLVWAFVSSLDDKVLHQKEYTQRTTIVLDVSNSMNVADGNSQGNSRLEVAKEKIQEIVRSVPHQFWLTVFAGSSQRIIPHTSDIGLYMTFLESVGRSSVSQWGTSISQALIAATQDFQKTPWGSIIVITDWGEESFTETWNLHEKLAGRNIFIVGVGTKDGGHILQGRDIFWNALYMEHQWKRVISSLSEKNLKNIASKLGGDYSHISTFSYIPNIVEGNFLYSISTTFLCVLLSALFWMYYVGHVLFYKYFSLWRK